MITQVTIVRPLTSNPLIGHLSGQGPKRVKSPLPIAIWDTPSLDISAVRCARILAAAAQSADPRSSGAEFVRARRSPPLCKADCFARLAANLGPSKAIGCHPTLDGSRIRSYSLDVHLMALPSAASHSVIVTP